MKIPTNISYFGTGCSLLLSNYLMAACGWVTPELAYDRSFFQAVAIFIIMQHVEGISPLEAFR